MAERKGSVARIADELAEPFPAGRVARVRDLVLEDLAEELQLEHRADDRGVAKQHPVRRLERVDTRREQALDRLRQRLERFTLPGRDDELADEERVAAGSLGERGERFGR